MKHLKVASEMFLINILFAGLFLNIVTFGVATHDKTYDTSKKCSMGLGAPLLAAYNVNNCSELNTTVPSNFAEHFEDVDSLVLTTRAGEGFLLSLSECIQIYNDGIALARKLNKKVFALVGSATTVGMQLARTAANLQVDGILMDIAYFYKPKNTEQIVYAMQLLSGCAPGIPLLLRVDPVLTKGLNLNFLEIYTRLTESIPNFAGFVGTLDLSLQIRAYGLYDPETQCLIASHHYEIQSANENGFDGVLTAAASLFPKLSAEIWNGKNMELIARNQLKLDQLFAAVTNKPNNRDGFSDLKAAYQIITGQVIGNPRPPIKPATCERKILITNQLEKLKVKLLAPVRSCSNDNTSCSAYALSCPIDCQ